jgi:hypothetical protein
LVAKILPKYKKCKNWTLKYNMQLNNAQKNCPAHEREMLVIVFTLKKWCADLLGAHFLSTLIIKHLRVSIHKRTCYVDTASSDALDDCIPLLMSVQSMLITRDISKDSWLLSLRV